MNEDKKSGKLLMDDSPLVFSPTLAKTKQIKLYGAIILQQIHYLCNQTKSGKVLDDGEKYVWNTYEGWQSDYFPFWSVATIKRHFLDLENGNLLLSRKEKANSYNQTKYYRVNTPLIEKIKGILMLQIEPLNNE